MDKLSEIGLMIAKRRRSLKMTQEELAEKAELSRQSICNIEQGKQRPGGKTILRICEALNMEADQLLIYELFGFSKVRDQRIVLLEKRLQEMPKDKQNTFFELVDAIIDKI